MKQLNRLLMLELLAIMAATVAWADVVTKYNFDDKSMQGWTTIDADGDGYNWMFVTSLMDDSNQAHYGSGDALVSQSYDVYNGVLYPDNYLVSPKVRLGGKISFYACAQDQDYPYEHFGVAVSTTSNTDPAAFTTIWENTMTASRAMARSRVMRAPRRTQGNWYGFEIDLSDYAGQDGYVAIRHFNCSDQFYLVVDDIEITFPITPISITWDADNKTATIDGGMPAGNVTVNVKYFPKAEFAMSNDEAPLKPKAKYDAQANSDMPLVKAGVVANIVEGEQTLDKKQGTLVYHVSDTPLTDLSAEDLDALLDVKDDEEDPWSEDVPTAAKIKQACTVYVYYYIRGAENVEGSTEGVTHTFNDSDIQMLTVNVQPEPVYDVELNDATAEAANWKAKVGTGEPSDNDVFPLTGVTKGQKVTVKYKGDRKVIGVKAEKLDLTTKVWKPGDKFHIGQAWFYYDDNNQNKCFHANGVESEVTNFNYDNHYEQWLFDSFVNVDKQIENDTESQFPPQTRPIWLSVPDGKSSSDTPVGFKIISGDGSKDSPYKFGLVY